MVHGNPTWSYYYRNVVKDFSKNHRTIVPDHMGCGFSDNPSDANYEYTLKSRVDDLEYLLDHLGINEKITLLVHDWGGMIGMAFATRHPDRIKRIIVTNTGAFHLPKTKKLPLSIKMVRNTPLGSFLVQGLNAFSRGANRYCVTRTPMTAAVKKDYLAPYDTWKNRRAVYHFVKDIPLKKSDRAYDIVSNVENNLSQFNKIPMLICWGAKDFVFDDHFLAQWKTSFPKAEVHRFKESGHYILEDSWTDIKPLFEKFIASNPIR